MAQQVNLDALIPREDFEVSDAETPAVPSSTIKITDLEPKAFFYNVLRKPDFQRETSDWSPKKICAFVQSFLDGDLIPALILWQAGSQVFVIDGAHRLSALIAWVHDDYGDGKTSKLFFDGTIPEEQLQVADQTRRLVGKQFGSYADHTFSVEHPEKAKQEVLHRAKRLGSFSIQLQWVKGDSTKAEESFFKINQQASPIDQTELRLLRSRKLPNALAARAIVRSGTGHKYWSGFEQNKRIEIEETAKEIYELLFSPSLKTPIKTLDLPVAGRGYSSQTLPLVFEFVNLANPAKGDAKILPDITGDETLDYLKKCKTLMRRVSGTHASSLGLHPAVYFYSSSGRYQPTAFLAVIALIQEMESRNGFKNFIKIRSEFEQFLIKYRKLVNQVTVKYGSGAKGYAKLYRLFSWLIQEFINSRSEDEIIEAMNKHDDFSFLQVLEKERINVSSDFNTDAKSAVFLRDALKDPLRCRICGGLIHRNSISIDHIRRKAEGGIGAPDNGQLTHPFCNTTIKN